MCLPMMPAGPESEVMNPILTVSADAGGAAARVARSPTRTARVIVRTVSSPRSRSRSCRCPHDPEMSFAILANASE